MNKESKLNLNAGDYAISHCDSDKTYNGLEVHRMLCDAYIAGNNDAFDDEAYRKAYYDGYNKCNRDWIYSQEDERIRQRTINLIKMSSEFGGFALHKWEADKMLAWLEKQGEHANFRNKIQVGDKVTRNEDGVLVNLSQLNRVAKKNEKQGEKKPTQSPKAMTKLEEKLSSLVVAAVHTYCEKNLLDTPHFVGLILGDKMAKERSKEILTLAEEELRKIKQKPAEWSEEDKYMYDIVCGTIENTDINENTKYKLISWLQSLKGRAQPSKEWSEEDEKNLRRAIRATKVVYPVAADWLQSIQDRVQPQPKQEWNEEDESMLNEAIYLIRREPYRENDAEPIVDWLNGIKQRIMKGE